MFNLDVLMIITTPILILGITLLVIDFVDNNEEE
jgi:hypothetical protein|nr:MAG TPA: hypothetical protein [Caudoviricetes sp.]